MLKLNLFQCLLVSREAESVKMETRLRVTGPTIIEALVRQQILSDHSITQHWAHLLRQTTKVGSSLIPPLLSKRLFQNVHQENSNSLTCKMLAKSWNPKITQKSNLRALHEDLKGIPILRPFKMSSLNKMITLLERSKLSRGPQTSRCASLKEVLENTTKT